MTNIKGEIGSNIIIVGDFNTTLISMGRSSRQKISKETQALNNPLCQIKLIDTYRTFHQKIAEYTFFSIVNVNCSRIDHMLGQKTSLNKFKNI